MSPLYRSLLAFAVLYVANAHVTELSEGLGSRCAGFVMDITSRKFGGVIKELQTVFQTSGDGQLHEIKDRCALELGAATSRQTVRVCNEFIDDPKLPVVRYPPKVYSLGDEKLSPIFAACGPWVEANHKCGPLTFHITQECSYPYLSLGGSRP